MAGGVLFGTCVRCGELVWEDEDWDFVNDQVKVIEHLSCRNRGTQTIEITGIVLAKVVKNGVLTLVVEISDDYEDEREYDHGRV